MKIMTSFVCSAFDEITVGSKVLQADALFEAVAHQIDELHRSAEKAGITALDPKMMLEMPEETYSLVSAGVGKRTDDPADYHVQVHRGRAEVYLGRQHAAPVSNLRIRVYVAEEYLKDPQVKANPEEVERITSQGATHVVVAVLADADPQSPLTPYRLVSNLAGGNSDFAEDKITVPGLIGLAKQSVEYWDEWCVVAD
jgi:hypothetical protein